MQWKTQFLARIGAFALGAHATMVCAGPIDDLKVESDERVRAINSRTTLLTRHAELAAVARRLMQTPNCRDEVLPGIPSQSQLQIAYSCRTWLREASAEIAARLESVQAIEKSNYGREMFSPQTLAIFSENTASATRVVKSLRDAARLLSSKIALYSPKDAPFCSIQAPSHFATFATVQQDYTKAKLSAKPNAMQTAIAAMYAESSHLRAKTVFCSSEEFSSVSYYAQQMLLSMVRDSTESSEDVVRRACALAKLTPQGTEACRMSRLSIEGAAVVDAFATPR